MYDNIAWKNSIQVVIRNVKDICVSLIYIQ